MFLLIGISIELSSVGCDDLCVVNVSMVYYYLGIILLYSLNIPPQIINKSSRITKIDPNTLPIMPALSFVVDLINREGLLSAMI